jgi:hypothetical protein
MREPSWKKGFSQQKTVGWMKRREEREGVGWRAVREEMASGAIEVGGGDVVRGV